MFHDLKMIDAIRASGVAVSEDCEQAWLFQWAKRNEGQYPELALLFAVPNGGHRSKRQGALLKLTGVKKGVPDTFLPVPRGEYHGLWVEMKSLSKSARVSPEQRKWIADLKDQGYRAAVCRGFEAARDEILAYLTLGAHRGA